MVTTLLQQLRLNYPTGDFCEAANLQWWWRKDQHINERGQTFWMDGDRPIGALIFTDWGDYWGCDLIYAPDNMIVRNQVMEYLAFQLPFFDNRPIEISLYDGDSSLDQILSLGFQRTNDIYVENWMSIDDVPPISPLAEGFKLVKRADGNHLPHHMIRRNGDLIESRLSECSLYHADLDLVIYTDTGEIAAYSLFWTDPITSVGLIEPMRTEDVYQRRGLAKHLLTSGLTALAQAGCIRFKITFKEGNESAIKLYLGIGFKPASTFRVYRKIVQ